ncbi:MAG: sigma factor RpoE negative regulatory protein RseB [Proteobacteria bacterium]|nr:sigma factor RpoE negative regulatory protein RseB [Pseudomonadota bacterium]MBS1246566.1 sigma factor RpoE negative regulatory protein RseB [Pseudomonadota bacterium]
MTGFFLRRFTLAVQLGFAASLAQAADAQTLFARMHQVGRSLDYEGTFVYQHGDQLESLRIVHKTGTGGVRERLVSLNGAPREIIRTDSEVRCYLPDENAALIEHRRAGDRNFPTLLPDSLALLEGNYKVHVGKEGRVAGRKAVSVRIKPRDAYRYGYLLWADEASGLLLKASLLDEHGGVVEQYMFTQVSIGKPIPESELKPQYPTKGIVWQRADDETQALSTGQWTAARLPAGFTLSARMMRMLPAHKQPVEHLVYSDGLAVVSVFVEKVGDEAIPNALSGLTHMGAVHAFGKVVDGHQITVVGEAPALTVDMIGESVRLGP